jgi:D-glutamate cyclase
MSGVFNDIERLIGRVVRRDISRLTDFARGHLQRAATSLTEVERPHVGIVAGFFVRHANPPSPETDGLNGMGQLAAGLTEAGIRVTVITDAPCAKAVWAVIDNLPCKVDLEIVSVDEAAVRRLRRHLETQLQPLTHLVAIERVAPGSDGLPHREHGWDMSRETAPLHLLFIEPGWKPPWVTIGIGDGGNEIGMGLLPKEIVEQDIPNGSLIAGATPTDHLIVAGVSNWGAYGLLAGAALIKPHLASALLKHFTPESEQKLLRAAVEVGQAVDGSRIDGPGSLQMSIDGLPLAEHAQLITAMRDLIAPYLPAETLPATRAK